MLLTGIGRQSTEEQEHFISIGVTINELQLSNNMDCQSLSIWVRVA